MKKFLFAAIVDFIKSEIIVDIDSVSTGIRIRVEILGRLILDKLIKYPEGNASMFSNIDIRIGGRGDDKAIL